MASTVWKNIILIGAFFALAPLALGISLFALVTLDIKKPASPNKIAAVGPSVYQKPKYGARVYASLPSKNPSVGGIVEAGDARSEIVRQYLERYNSPLVPYADTLVAEADRNGLDFRLTTAIAQQESNLCKAYPEWTYNCWGWGIHSEGTLGFSSFNEAIATVSQGLKENYIDLGLTTPDEIMGKYTPLSNGSWARGVNEFMAEME